MLPVAPHEDPVAQQSMPPLAIQSYRTPVNRFKKLHLGTTIYEVRLSFGTFRVRLVENAVIEQSSEPTRREVSKLPKHKKIIATFLPRFATWRILECTFTQRNNSVDAGLRTFNFRPGWSPVFDYASRGNLQKVRNLIEEGLASPNDVDQDGWTVLHVSLLVSSHAPQLALTLALVFSAQQRLINSRSARCFWL